MSELDFRKEVVKELRKLNANLEDNTLELSRIREMIHVVRERRDAGQ